MINWPTVISYVLVIYLSMVLVCGLNYLHTHKGRVKKVQLVVASFLWFIIPVWLLLFYLVCRSIGWTKEDDEKRRTEENQNKY